MTQKSKNLATKQDIGKITKELETVKNEISAYKQRETDFIYKRTECMISFLNLLDDLDLFRMKMDMLFNSLKRPSFSEEYLLQLEDYINRLSMKYRLTILYNPYPNSNEGIKKAYNDTNIYYNFLYRTAFEFHTYSQNYLYYDAVHNYKETEKIYASAKVLCKEFTDQDDKIHSKYQKGVDEYNIYLEFYFKENLNIELKLHKDIDTK